jgi:hypothetical protein
MMLQVVLDHFFRHLAGRETKIAVIPEVPSLIAFFQLRERLKQFRRRTILRDEYKVVLNFENRMATVSIIHHHQQPLQKASKINLTA